MLVYTCILSGCDYLESIKGIGFKTAIKLVQQHSTNLSAIMQELHRMKLEVNVSQYSESFRHSFLTFEHHIVYDPIGKKQVYLSNPSTEVSFIGMI